MGKGPVGWERGCMDELYVSVLQRCSCPLFRPVGLSAPSGFEGAYESFNRGHRSSTIGGCSTGRTPDNVGPVRLVRSQRSENLVDAASGHCISGQRTESEIWEISPPPGIPVAPPEGFRELSILCDVIMRHYFPSRPSVRVSCGLFDHL